MFKSKSLYLFPTLIVLLFLVACSHKVIHVTVHTKKNNKTEISTYLVEIREGSQFKVGEITFTIDSVINDTALILSSARSLAISGFVNTPYGNQSKLTVHPNNLLICSRANREDRVYSYNFRIIDSDRYRELPNENYNVVEVSELDNIDSIIFVRQIYNENNKLQKRWLERYRNTMLEIFGPIQEWNDSGLLIKSAYIAERKLDSIYYEWYDNGTLETEGQFELGKRNGEWKYYNPDSSLLYYGRYQNDAGTLFYADGAIRSIENIEPHIKRSWYHNGLRQAVLNNVGTNYYKDDGTPFWSTYLARNSFFNYNMSIFFDEPYYTTNDTLLSRTYWNPKKWLKRVFYDADSNLTRIKNYYEDGKTICEINYKDGVQDGKAQTWSPGGVLIYDFFYRQGKRDSVWYYYDYYGNMIKKEVYDMGALLSADTFEVQ